MPAELKGALMLDMLDEDTARFTGSDTAEIERHNFLGTVVFQGKFPLVIIGRDTWVDMGCPTLLEFSLSEVTADDRPSV